MSIMEEVVGKIRYYAKSRAYHKKRRLEDAEWAQGQRDHVASYRLTKQGKWVESKNSARRRGHAWEFQEKGPFFAMLDMDCYYCGKKSCWGIDRKDSSGSYNYPNCVPCCTPCNTKKQAMDFDEFVLKHPRKTTN